MDCDGLRYTDFNEKVIKKVALCSGAGGSFIRDAIKVQADVFITGEIKHSEILEANHNGLMVVDAGHFKTEDLVMDSLKEVLERNFQEVNFYKSEVFIDKIKYL